MYNCIICNKSSNEPDFLMKPYNTPVSIPVYYVKTDTKIIYFCGPSHSLTWYNQNNDIKN